MAETEVMSAAEYAASVEQWLHQAYHRQIWALGFPTYLAYQAAWSARPAPPPASGGPSSSGPSPFSPYHAVPPRPATPAPPPTLEFTIPPIWKRFTAEFVDFATLFCLKLLITYLVIDMLELFDVESFFRKHDRSLYLLAAGHEIDIEDAYELTSDIVVLEIIHRFVVCIYEIMCTFRGRSNMPGGATPGKLLMGLRIYRCDSIAMTTHPNRVKVSPATDLGLFWASIRSVIKNTSVALLFPVFMTFLFMPYNRTLYDVMSKSIVVEVDTDTVRQLQNRPNDAPRPHR
eukprot:maker-scaffold1086_size63525-snap-gene-0.12 protein:Tk01500 transcript:maker-scaffold1086_size63525-snap-gene-0.12-mRNA-1 annotation:"protein fam8a1-like"